MRSKGYCLRRGFCFFEHYGQIGRQRSLLLAQNKRNAKERYLVKHCYTDCACNEFVYTKLAQEMGYSMPDAVLFRLGNDKALERFRTEYVIGERFLNVVEENPSYDVVQETAVNREQYFAFYGLYAMTGEGDGVEILLADDKKIYRVDTTDAFPISNRFLDIAGVNFETDGINLNAETKRSLLSLNFNKTMSRSNCDFCLKQCLKEDPDCSRRFLEPFERIQQIPQDHIDGFLDTLCYFYPDYIGDFFKLFFPVCKSSARHI